MYDAPTHAGREALAAPSLSLTADELATATGLRQPPPDIMMGSLSTWVREDGTVGIEGAGGPLLSMSLALFAQQQSEAARFIWVRDGVVVVEGFDRAGNPVELKYRAIGLHAVDTDRLAVNEGGYLLLELLKVTS